MQGGILDNIDDKYYQDPDIQTPVQFINDDIKTLNKCLEEGRYFYTQIKQEGIVLYDSGRFKLARRRKLNYAEIKQQTEEYFKEKYNNAESFYRNSIHAYNDKGYKLGSFLLHQASKNLIYATRLVFTLENNKQHNLAKLLNSVKRYSIKFEEIFSRETVEEKRLFNLIKAAYVEARYNPQFVVTKEDIEALTPKVNQFFEVVREICEKRIKEYGEMK
ncbi:MAG: HEPN domain-containing protein [Prevotellaceae bacterium]|jgi:HEPN domain-containing protein|nr:HEPN domain-containing protein [Prevotellaceae bacterium]